MNNDNPQPDTPFDAQPNQPAPRFGGERNIVQPLDPRRSVDSIQVRRPAQSQPQPNQNPAYPAQPMSPVQQPPRQPVRDSSFSAPQQPSPQPQSQRPHPNSVYPQPTGFSQPSPQPQPQQPQPNQNPAYPAQPMSPTREVQPQPISNANSIYPGATTGRGADPIPVPAQKDYTPAKPDKKTQTTTTLVMAFGAFMVVMSALSLISWLGVGLVGAGEILGFILALANLALGFGILMKREAARSAYVILSVIMLVFSVIGTIIYIGEQSSNNTSNIPQVVGLRQAIQKYENNNSLTQAQKDKYIQVLQNSESVVEKQQSAINERGKVELPFLNIFEGYVIAVLPIAFLTRPSIKKVFS